MKLLLIPVLWANDPVSLPGWYLPDLAATLTDWYRENSYGKFGFDVTTAPFVRIAATNSSTDSNLIFGQANVELLKVGLNSNNYDRLVYLTSSSSVSGKGINYGRVSWVWVAGSTECWSRCAHELGHSLGLSHSGTLQIGSRSGNRRTLPGLTPAETAAATSQFNALYDPTTTMGYVPNGVHFAPSEKLNLGWLSYSQFPVYTTGDHTFTLTPLSQAGGSVYGVIIKPQTLVPTAQRTYWLEYRAAIGYDRGLAGAGSGVLLRLSGDFGCVKPTVLIKDIYDQPLDVGTTITDGTISIDVIGPGVVRVYDSGAPLPPPVVPPPTTNADIIAAMQAQLNGWTADMVTQTQIDALKTLVNQLAADGTAPPVTPPSVTPPAAGASPAGTTITYGGSLVDGNGATWAIATSPHGELRVNGVGAGGFWAVQCRWTGTRIEAQSQDNLSWSYWTGTSWARM
jgi:hypothetical protein